MIKSSSVAEGDKNGGVKFEWWERAGKFELILHSDGLKTLQKALTYVTQQKNAMAVDVSLIKVWRSIAAKNTNNTTTKK